MTIAPRVPSIVAMLLVFSVSSLVACTKDPLAPSPGPQVSAPPAERSCPRVAESTVTGTIADPALDEISGVVVGHRMDGFLWVEEDSGNDASVYALEPSGEVVAEVMVDGATNEDWEDLAWANGRLWVGDIGDNERDRSVIHTYSFPEPSDRSVTSVDATIVRLRYEDGRTMPRRCSSILATAPYSSRNSSRSLRARCTPSVRGASGEVGVSAGRARRSIVTAADLDRRIAVRNYLRAGVPWSDDRHVSTQGSRPRAPGRCERARHRD
jgi:hypothetical protein